MSIKIIASLEGFRNKTNWPFYYYVQRLQNLGYPDSYIEAFLEKLQKETISGEDPDVVLQRITSELGTFGKPMDPYRYPGNRPENT